MVAGKQQWAAVCQSAMAQPGLVLASCLSLAALAAGQQDPAYVPVNRYFSVEADRPRPDLECVVRTGQHWSVVFCTAVQVGVDSAATSQLYKVRCDQAWNISVKLDKKKANALFADHFISDQVTLLRNLLSTNILSPGPDPAHCAIRDPGKRNQVRGQALLGQLDGASIEGRELGLRLPAHHPHRHLRLHPRGAALH